MKLSAILLARTIAIVDINDLNPSGKVFLPDLVPEIVQKFRFQSFPSTPEDFDEAKGIKFADGYSHDTTVDKLTIWRDGLTLDTRASTAVGKKILEDSLAWLNQIAGLEYTPDKIVRWAYLSNLTFFSDVDLTAIHPVLAKISRRLAEMSTLPVVEQPQFELVSLSLDFDKSGSKLNPASFKIERRGGVPFSRHKYFSEAAVDTSQHLELIKELESGIMEVSTPQ